MPILTALYRKAIIMDKIIVTVSQLNAFVKKALDSQTVLNDIWIKGEISNFKQHYSGHLYITLKDEGGVLKAVMFKSAAARLTFLPKDGMKVVARGRISVYEAGGAYQLYVSEIIPDGIGELFMAYEQLKKRLAEKGLFEQSHKKPIPRLPQRIGVITAATGAAVRDIVNVASRRFPLAEIIIFPSLVQGDGAAADICRGIEYFNKNRAADVLIVGRGGGSIEDLWAFNEETVAYAIYNSEIPIISAVGHETDFTIADFAADLRAPTPSAAAELAVPSQAELLRNVVHCGDRLINAVYSCIETRELRLSGIKLRTPGDIINEGCQKLDTLVRRLERGFEAFAESERGRLAKSCARLDALSPLRVMSRGYALPIDENGDIIKTAEELTEKKNFNLRMTDGSVSCRVLEKNGGNYGENI